MRVRAPNLLGVRSSGGGAYSFYDAFDGPTGQALAAPWVNAFGTSGARYDGQGGIIAPENSSHNLLDGYLTVSGSRAEFRVTGYGSGINCAWGTYARIEGGGMRCYFAPAFGGGEVILADITTLEESFALEFAGAQTRVWAGNTLLTTLNVDGRGYIGINLRNFSGVRGLEFALTL